MAILQSEYPEMVHMYEELYASRYVKKDYEKRVQEVVSLMRQRYGVGDRRPKSTKKATPPAAEVDLRLLQPEE